MFQRSFLLCPAFFFGWIFFLNAGLSPQPAAAQASTAEAGLSQSPAALPLSVQPSGDLSVNPRLISATVITAEDIRRDCPGCDFTDILERAGVNIRRFHSNFFESSDTDTVYLGLRGVSDAQTALYIDGVRIRDVMLAQPEWNFITTGNIERIEIVRGPRASGNGAVGGEVRVYTKKADCNPSDESDAAADDSDFCARVRTEISNKPATGGSAFVSAAGRKGDDTGFSVSFQGDRSRDSHGIDYPSQSSSYDEGALSLSFNHQKEQQGFEGSAVFYNSGNKGAVTPYTQSGSSHAASLGTVYKLDPDLLIKALAGYNRERQSYGDSDESDQYTSRRISLSLWSEYHFESEGGGDYVFKTGAEGHVETIDSPPDIYEEERRNTTAGFAEFLGEQGPFVYQVKARADRLSGDIDEAVWTFRGDVSYHIGRAAGHDVFLRTGAGSGFRAPGLDEQYYEYSSRICEEGGKECYTVKYPGNPDLGLETAVSYETGLRIEKPEAYFLDIGAFNTTVKDSVKFSERTPDRSQKSSKKTRTYIVRKEAADDVRIQGLEFQTGFYLGDCDGKAQYGLINSDGDAARIRGRNPVRRLGFANLGCDINPKIRIGADVFYRGERQKHNPPGDNASVWNAHISYTPDARNKDTIFQIAVKNIGDKEYDLYNYTRGGGRTVWLIFETPLF